MAFIREYAAMSGDPFSLRGIGRKLKRVHVGHLLGKVAHVGARFIPGGGIAERAVGLLGRVKGMRGGKSSRFRQAFARMYGMAEGDPPAPKSRRKQAASGPQHKADRKAAHREGKPHVDPHDKRRGRGQSLIFGSHPKLDIHGGLTSLAQLAGQSGIADALAKAHAKDFPELAGMHAGMGGHRRINPTNVHALKRSLRRVDGFAKLAQKVQRDAGKILRHVHREPRGMYRGHGRGHKPGCKCVVCSRA